MRALLLMTFLFASAAAFARPAQAFVPDDADAAKVVRAPPRDELDAFGEENLAKKKPFPWGAVTFLGLVLIGATPFAIRAYKNTSKELAGSADD